MQGEGVPIFDFPVLSDDRVYAGRTLDEAGPGEAVLSDETVWELVGTDEHWEPGTYLGKVTIQEIPTTRPGRTEYCATFDFDDHDPIVVTGFVPGNGSWIGRGRGAAHGGNRHGAVDVEGRNPKRWG
jgi:hypothetical protein